LTFPAVQGLAVVEPLPTLDAVAADPGALDGLPGLALHALALRALAVHQACALALLAAPSAPPAGAADPAQLVRAADVARRLGLSRREVYRQARVFPFASFVVHPTPGTVRFRLALVEEYAHDPDAYRRRHAGARKAG